ncbi:MAG: tetratricopeptide repeat protein, partial [Herminiimonas sp.]|nr:tetratricopeptide repeat protein [Herminiimonas sp.]
MKLPRARLRLDNRNFSDATLCDDIHAKFAAFGIMPDQLIIGFTSPVWNVYGEADIVLDCFPHNSGTTTYEALWMGLPVITLASRPSVGRLGASILSCIGRPEWIARDCDEYIERAVALAEDIPALEKIRASLRAEMQASPLLDRPGFVRDMENAYRAMWQTWCDSAPQNPTGGNQVDGESDQSTLTFDAALVHHQAGRLEQAASIYQTMLDNPDAQHLLGVVASQLSHYELAIEHILGAIRDNPTNAAYYCNLGSAYQSLKRFDEAAVNFRTALALEPGYALACNNLGNALKDLGRKEEAVDSFRKALTLKPDYAEAYSNLGSTLRDLGKTDEAVECLQQAIALRPQFAEAHFNLGNTYREQGRLLAATESFQSAFAYKPDFYQALNNLGIALKDQGRLDDAIHVLHSALLIEPNYVEAHSNLLFCHNYHPTLSAEQIFDVYRKWNSSQAAPLALNAAPFHNEKNPDRRLKVGYVSADFHNHSVIHFAGPVIQHHDKSRFEVFCYANRGTRDEFTERIMASADHWVPCHQMSDEQLVHRVRDDGIDILVDLSGHTLGHRLLAFARRAAPVQVSWLGFGYTTGMTEMDFFIGDPIFTPAGCDSLFSESIFDLPDCMAVYTPPDAAPEPNPSPAIKNGYVTFACLSRRERINDRVIDAWATILHRLPTARLRLDCNVFGDSDMRSEMQDRFAVHGIPASRLEIGFTSPVWSVYQDADIVLDCFPHNSGTTTYEALWMGLPVVTLAERPSVGRLG